MKVILVCLALVGLAWAKQRSISLRTSGLSCNCGRRNSGRIVGGKETKANEYPWVVHMSNGCGGSIITSWHVLTAAHCTIGKSPRNIDVTVGGHRKYFGDEKNRRTYKLAKIVQHQRYDDDKILNDISILITATEIQFNEHVGPICMPTRKLSLVGTYVKVIGWGSTMGTGSSDLLREVDVKVIPVVDCKKQWENVTTSGTQLCAYEYRKDSCNGDSGGPLVYLDPETNRYTQAALVSYGAVNCGRTPEPSVNTDVSAFLDWIINAVSSTKRGVSICTKI